MDPASIGAVIVALIAALGAWASARSNSRAAMVNARAQAEVEAYSRARAMDDRTIKRQDEEIEEIKQNYDELNIRFKQISRDNELLHAENVALRRTHSQQVRKLHEENQALRERVERLEKQLEEQG